MKKRMKLFGGVLFFVACLGCCCTVKVSAMGKKTLYNSPYVTFSPDGRAWTFAEKLPAGVQDGWPSYYYQPGENVNTNVKSELRPLQPGEHYYRISRGGEIPVGRWVVAHAYAQCIHTEVSLDTFHGMSLSPIPCLARYYSGWLALCADCGEPVSKVLIYGSRQAVSSVHYIDTDLEDHYYVCPSCSHLEQGSPLSHMCKAISYNMYCVRYDPNQASIEAKVDGSMPDSMHMYNDATLLDGEKVAANQRLLSNSFWAEGYRMAGWTTNPDGTGEFYEDGERVKNLTAENYVPGTDKGVVTLYAKWTKVYTNLVIDPNGGTYLGRAEKTEMNSREYGSVLQISEDDIVPPKGYEVTFDCLGGTMEQQRLSSTFTLKRWRLLYPSQGKLEGSLYIFYGEDGHTDTVQAVYAPQAIPLPEPVRHGFWFGGWFADKSFSEYVGTGGEEFLPDRDMTLYAKWTLLTLRTEDVYYRDFEIHDYRTEHSINFGVKTKSGKGDNKYLTPGHEKAVCHATGAVDIKLGQGAANGEVFRLWISDEGDSCLRDEAYRNLVSAQDSQTVIQNVWKEVETEADKGEVFSGKNINYDYESVGNETQVYEASASGLYEIRLAGGQGGDYESRQGGLAGTFEIMVYLKKGEKLEIQLGGKGGGSNSLPTPGGLAGGASGEYGSAGGGATVLYVRDLTGSRTRLCVAAGGGGASSFVRGYAATDEYASPYTFEKNFEINATKFGLVHQEESNSINGGGGGAGVLWGMPGEVRYHSHAPKPDRTGDYPGQLENSDSLCSGWAWRDGGIHYGYVVAENCKHWGHWCNHGGAHYCDQGCTETAQYWGSCRSCGQTVVHGSITSYYNCRDCGAYLGESPYHRHGSYWESVCGKTEGETIDSGKASNGGLSYLDTENIHLAGNIVYDNNHEGNGCVTIVAKKVGFLDDSLAGSVKARDVAFPDGLGKIDIQVINENVELQWQEPESNGTTYYFYGESYVRKQGTMEKQLCTGVVAQTTESAIAGYYYLCDNSPETDIDYVRRKIQEQGLYQEFCEEDGYVCESHNAALHWKLLGFTEDTNLGQNDVGETGNRAFDRKAGYVHLAAVDVAGNIADSVTVSLGENAPIPWKAVTGRMTVSSVTDGGDGENIRKTEEENTWYVRADGRSRFLLSFPSYLPGAAREDYQIVKQEVHIMTGTDDASHQSIRLTLPYSVPLQKQVTLPGQLFRQQVFGPNLLEDGMFSECVRGEYGREQLFRKAFVIPAQWSGRKMKIVPVAGTEFEGKILYSDWEKDKQNGICVIADGEPPVIDGLDTLKEMNVINRKNRDMELCICAADSLSGVKDFSVTILNTDNQVTKSFYSTGEEIRLKITGDDPLYTGAFQVTVSAADLVGNRVEVTEDVKEFELETRIERILEPHSPVFKCGESGYLYITAHGYVERIEVEFPEEIKAGNSNLDTQIVYSVPQYVVQEQLKFMIPLYAEEGEDYEVTVRAYKGDGCLEQHPSFSTLSVRGSVLEEFRTRLR